MNLRYRILDADIFESYMALEGMDSFPFLKSIADKDGAMSFLMQDYNYMIFDYSPSDGFLKAICIYNILGDTLIIHFLEVNKKFRHMGIGAAAVDRLILETGTKRIELDAKDEDAAKFWRAMGMEQIDDQHFLVQ